MNIDRLKKSTQEAVDELQRLITVVENPERILGEFYKPYSENLLQYVMEYMNVTEDELYSCLIEQLGKMPMLANCKLSRIRNGPSSPILISYRKPGFKLLLIDIKGKRYENVFESVVRGLQTNINEAELELKRAESETMEAKEIAFKLHQLSGGEYDLRGFSAIARKRNIRVYLSNVKSTSINFTKEEIDKIVSNLGGEKGYMNRLAETIDKRQALLADAERAYSEAMDRKLEYDENPYLQNAVSDLTDMLLNSGYELKQDLSQIVREIATFDPKKKRK